MVSGVENPELKKFDGKTIAQIAEAQKKSQLDALFDFIIADKGKLGLSISWPARTTWSLD